MKQLGVVGFGAFGQFMCSHLAKHFEVFVYDNHNREKEAQALAVKLDSFENVVAKEIVILGMPMDKMESVLLDMRGKTQKGALIIDICSLKVFAEKLMKKHLKDVQIIGTHPLFGPQTAVDLKGCKIALCNFKASETTFLKVRQFCEQLGMNVIITTAKEHDHEMAVSQAVTHFVAHALQNSGFRKVPLSTKTSDKLMDIVDIVKQHPKALFEDMQIMNKEARKARKEFIRECIKTDKDLAEKENKTK